MQLRRQVLAQFQQRADGFDLLAYALSALLAWWLERRR